ncbi:hypothetical protein TPHA_0G02590 [Tetrapisispora phaffii CBS 4417]|uniref:Uncharacterized protein n=1 Tax=Tetrapisispora phaffii (strain ATCC 24235 / CBS 4417 / NBRC 1672 / NRRL Y-8282 / UCD 70-5) TaxID=1071381 RepID=G8BW17_TETPH|nr:hypothetical protein TPHA_0G02590 [Tetrapisispora phaffii CBS 4417]CCE64095.1 hypothetical protein TPHA_0G02590 [Tetrapisispora phaffii CBS 4417]
MQNIETPNTMNEDEELKKCLYSARRILKSLNSFQLMSPLEDSSDSRNRIDNLQTPLTQRTFTKINLEIKNAIDSTEIGKDFETLESSNTFTDKNITPKSLSPTNTNTNEISSNDNNSIFTSTDSTHSVETKPSTLDLSNNINSQQICTTIKSLVDMLNLMSQEVQKLKFKNSLLSSQESESKNNYKLELNLQKQQFEKLKFQLNEENTLYLSDIKNKDNKVKKYKSKIMEKNQEINKLRRLLNNNPIYVNNNSVTPHNTKTMAVPGRRVVSMNSSLSPVTVNKKEGPDMLNALGLLASHVLNDKIQLDNCMDNIPRTITDNDEQNSVNSQDSQTEKIGDQYIETKNNKPADSETTINAELTINNDLTEDLSTVNKAVALPERPPKDNKLLLTSENLTLPKMRSFSTMDGSTGNI